MGQNRINSVSVAKRETAVGKHLSDSEIQSAINTLARSEAPLTVARVKKYLVDKHGRHGSTDRVLRLIQEARRLGKEADVQMLRLQCAQQQSDIANLQARLIDAQQATEHLQRKLAISEERGRVDQDRWMMELDGLRQRSLTAGAGWRQTGTIASKYPLLGQLILSRDTQ
jgi:predicted RNase H-like nuclease (RuvC/YqgF family)